MAIDMTPKVGRIVVLRAPSSAFFPWFMKGGKITRFTDKVIFYEQGGVERKAMGYAAICDNPREEKTLLDFTTRGEEEYAALKAKLTQERIKLHPVAYGSATDAKGNKATPAPAPKPRSRVRPAQSVSEPKPAGRRRRYRAG